MDITVNFLASIDRLDFFQQLTNKQLEKLIWIPDNWVDNVSWKIVVKVTQQEIVEKAHKQHYFSQ